MTKKVIFIPMGPACIAAGILHMAGLRSCSFPLDWGRSGSSILRDLFILTAEECYWRHFHAPNITLEQDPVPTSTDMYDISHKSPKYGFPYFYNPHRPLGTSMEYHIRCLNRFKLVNTNPQIRKEFFFADRLDNKGETYFKDPKMALEFIATTINSSVSGEFRITLCRINTTKTTLPCVNEEYINENSRIVNVTYPLVLTDEAYHGYAVAACFPSTFFKINSIVNPLGHIYAQSIHPAFCCLREDIFGKSMLKSNQLQGSK